MPLLPRSRRGTLLLAGAVWLTACAGYWWVLPVVPRGVMKLPEWSHLIALGPDSATAIVERLLTDPRGDPQHRAHALELLQVPSGRQIARLADNCQSVTHAGTSKDGRVSVLYLSRANSTGLLRFDWISRTAQELSIGPIRSGYSWRPALSPDGRFFFFERPGKERTRGIWDVVHDRLGGILPNASSDFCFAADSRSIAVGSSNRKLQVCVFDLATLAPTATFLGVGEHDMQPVGLTADGVCATLSCWYDAKETAHGEFCCWDVSTGRQLYRESVGRAHVRCGFKMASVRTVPQIGSGALRFFDFATLRWCPHTFECNHCELSPDGQTVLILDPNFSHNPRQELVERLRLPLLYEEGGTFRLCAHDGPTGKHLGDIILEWRPRMTVRVGGSPYGLVWSPDGTSVAAASFSYERGTWCLWDIPPRKSLTWFAAGAAMFALPIAMIARRRVRRLRAA
jgi:WD40 repeat protein